MDFQNPTKAAPINAADSAENQQEMSSSLAPPPFQLMAGDANDGRGRRRSSPESSPEEKAAESPPSRGLRMPLEQKAGSGEKYMPFCDFIERIKGEEAANPKASTNIPLMITLLRKIFYATPGWEDYLIPDRSEIKGRYVVEDGATTTKSIHWGMIHERTLTGPQTLKRNEGEKGMPRPDWMDPYLGQKDIYPQEVELPDGNIVDIGHVLAGLDALNFPSAVGHVSGLGPRIEDNAGASTWVGDLGSVLGETLLIHMESADGEETPIAWDEIQTQIDALAPAKDMMGNIDAYVIAANYDTKEVGERTVSDILQDYYLGTKREELKPYTTFAKQVGLGYLATGLQGSEEVEWINAMSMEVSNAAVQYFLLQLNKVPKYSLALFNYLPYTEYFVLNSEHLLIAFINELHAKILQEKKR